MKTRVSKTYYGNTLYMRGLLNGLGDCDMLLRTGESNTIGWIAGHMVYYRGQILDKLNVPYDTSEIENRFARGAEKNTELKVEMQWAVDEFVSRGEKIVNAINEMDEETLMKDSGVELPGDSRDVETYLQFLAWHETFHLGQIDLIKAAAGKGGIK